MMLRRRFIWLIMLLAAGLLLPAMPALVDDGPPDDGGITILGEDYTLEEGERLDGDLVVINGDVIVRVLSIDGERVKIGVDAPRSIAVLREELLEEVAGENREAASRPPGGTDPVADVLEDLWK